MWPRTALCRGSRLERQGARRDWKGCCCSWTMLLLPPLPLVDSGMSTFLEWICISESLQVGVHEVLQFK
uniref:Uncharacterized protein n=1 Tax=Triticum urartu TaxID=4572 RepID=A0A8R7Q073_TRIUA